MPCAPRERGWELVRGRLPPELQTHSSLCAELVLLSSSSLPAEDEATKALTGIKRGQQTVQVLVGVIQVATEMLASTAPTRSRPRMVIKL